MSFCGYISSNEDISNDEIINKMVNTLTINKQNRKEIYVSNNIALGSCNFNNDNTYLQPYNIDIYESMWSIVFDGELYNSLEIKSLLLQKGYEINTNFDYELVLKAYIEFGDKCLNLFNGVFSFVIYDEKTSSLFMARDHLGIKPLYYTLDETTNTYIFASRIKSILAHPSITPILNKQGLMEMIGLGPAHTPGITYFKDIFELKAGEVLYFTNNKLLKHTYWDLKAKKCNDNIDEAIEKVRSLVQMSTKRQVLNTNNIASMLSGGIDSSILATITNDLIPNLDTFSIDFKDNDINFKANDYQGSKDSEFVKIMVEFLKTKHHNIYFDNDTLYNYLIPSLIARDMPGMADIDSSIYAFCDEISNQKIDVCISGECSDEIFGGYPWYYKEHLANTQGFYWSRSNNIRNDVLKKGLLKENELDEYINYRFNETLDKVEHLDDEDELEKKFRNINYMTIKWFMNTLVERTERTASQSNLTVRIPFADKELFEYVYNLPAKMKLGLIQDNSTPVEKYLLRKVFEDKLPESVIHRKKSPFPKTYDPVYLNLVKTEMQNILNDKTSRIHEILNTEYIQSLLDNNGENLQENWFGQLMTYPQTLAYFIQIENWLKIYDIKIEL